MENDRPTKKVLAIVVTYNRLDMLKGCISHLLAQTYPCDIMIVDNASTDATGEWCKSLLTGKHNIIYENTGANIGGAGGFNYGMRRCVELGYDYAWVMDDDSFAQTDCLEKLAEAADKVGEFGFLSSACLWTDGSLCKMNWQRKYPLPKKTSEHHLTQEDLSQELAGIQSCTFVSAFFPVKVIKKVGLPIKEFFIWCDDIEYTRRITLKYKYPAYAVTQSRIVHHIKNNEGTSLATDDPERIPRYNYAFRNENYMYRQYGLKGFAYYLVVIAFNTFKVIARSKSYKMKRLGVIYRNLITGIAFNPKIEYVSDDH